jgi:glycine/D-amino acid oxidase-like deaminating enzyme
MSNVVVLGSGIVGLYTAYSLIYYAKINPSKINVIAEYLPGDSSINFTSPWAGGNFSCITPNDADTLAYDKFTYTHLAEIQSKLGPNCGLAMKPSTEYWDVYPGDEKINSLKSYLKDFKVVPKSELPEGVAFGITFTTWNFYCPLFIAKLRKYLETLGVVFKRQKLTHISQAYLPHTIAVFNCTGIGAFSISGVKDSNVYPTRGQVLVVKAPHVQENKMRWGADYATYIIPRPHSGGQLILGGFLQKDNWTGDTFEEESKDIIERTTKLLPKILDRPIEILGVAAGLRPSRYGGARIEAQLIEEKLLIHNYGAGGYGYQAGFGMSFRAVELFKENKKLAAKL